MLEIAGTLVGLLYLWLEYKASIYLWVASIVMPAIYIFVYYDAGLYADFGVNLYYLLIAVYGWWSWKHGVLSNTSAEANHSKELPITHLPKRRWIPLTMTTLLIFALIGGILIYFTDSDVPWLDALTTALSITGMWLLAQKHIEQWWVWMVVDLVSVGLYIYKDLQFTAILYFLYAVIAVLGYRKWKQIMHSSPTSTQ